MSNLQGFDKIWREDAELSLPPAAGNDVEEHTREKCKRSWNLAMKAKAEMPDKFVTRDEAEVIATEILRDYLTKCGCRNGDEEYKAGLLFAAVANGFVGFMQEQIKKEHPLVLVSGSNITKH